MPYNLKIIKKGITLEEKKDNENLLNEGSNENEIMTIQDDLIRLIRERYQLQDELKTNAKNNREEMKKILLKFLEVIDAFDRVFENIQSKEKEINQQMKIWVGNFKSVRRLLLSNLRECGVHPIEAPAGKAVPGLYTIIETKEMPHLEKDIILEELEKGYLWHDEILRKAKVITVKN